MKARCSRISDHSCMYFFLARVYRSAYMTDSRKALWHKGFKRDERTVFYFVKRQESWLQASEFLGTLTLTECTRSERSAQKKKQKDTSPFGGLTLSAHGRIRHAVFHYCVRGRKWVRGVSKKEKGSSSHDSPFLCSSATGNPLSDMISVLYHFL